MAFIIGLLIVGAIEFLACVWVMRSNNKLLNQYKQKPKGLAKDVDWRLDEYFTKGVKKV
jgi:hypothetical protein